MSKTAEFRVLGPLEVVHDGVAKRIGSPTQRTLLALLLMNPNEVVSTDRIVDVLWPDNPTEGRRKLWFHVSKLRATLEPDGAEDAATLETRPSGYTLRLDLDRLDAARFERLAHDARSLLEDEPNRAAEMLRRALALWRDRPFADVLHEDAVSSEVARLDEIRVTALEERLDADLVLGRAGELVPELEALVAEHPFREHPHAQLMLALYRAGRHAEALAAYAQARRILVIELGIEPSERLKELQRRILGQDPTLIASRPPPPGTGMPREERKLVTVLLAGLTDLTASDGQRDPEDSRAALGPYYAHIHADLERFGGTVETLTGDSAMALFGVPAAHEDDPERAVRAALAIRDWLHEQGRQVPLAVATSEAHVTLGGFEMEREPVVVGDVVTVAARLQAAAPAAGVFVCEQTFGATRHAVEYREAEPVAAAGRIAPIRAWEAIRTLVEPGSGLARHSSPFIGRERELVALKERLDWAASQRSPQLVTILGVPGIGKTRLVSELQQESVGADEPMRWRQGRSLPYGDGVSFWALGEIVKEEAGILESDAAQKAGFKLRGAVRRVIDDQAEAGRVATFLGALIGLGGEEPAVGNRRGEMFAAWRRFLEALADERPLVLVFEDLHWADDALLDFVDELVDGVSGVPLLVIATARPELHEHRPGWAGGKPGALTISLPPLSRRDATQLVAALMERSTVPAESYEALLARIGGNPLYAEQLCRMLIEHGRLEELPDTLRSIIAARLDALPTSRSGCCKRPQSSARSSGPVRSRRSAASRAAKRKNSCMGSSGGSSFGERASRRSQETSNTRSVTSCSAKSPTRRSRERREPSDTGTRPSGSTRSVGRKTTPSCLPTTTSPHSRTKARPVEKSHCLSSAPSKRSTARACGRSGCRRTSARSSTSPGRSPSWAGSKGTSAPAGRRSFRCSWEWRCSRFAGSAHPKSSGPTHAPPN